MCRCKRPVSENILNEKEKVFRHGFHGLTRSLADTWADLGSLEGLYYFRSRKGREVDFVHFNTPTGHPFGVEVKYQSRFSGWDEQSISKGIGQGVLVTRDSFK